MATEGIKTKGADKIKWSKRPAPKFDGEWQNWNPKKIWSRSSKGLGMGKVFDLCNEIYGKDFYRYE